MYYIYHIPGEKIGLSQTPKDRVKAQGFTDYEILEEHLDGWFAGDRELELQRQYGYRVDNKHYMKVLEMQSIEASSRGGKTQGLKLKNSGAISRLGKRTQFNNIRRNVTYEQAAEIRTKHNGVYGDTKRLAEEYKVSSATISRIVNNKQYTHE